MCTIMAITLKAQQKINTFLHIVKYWYILLFLLYINMFSDDCIEIYIVISLQHQSYSGNKACFLFSRNQGEVVNAYSKKEVKLEKSRCEKESSG